MNIAMAIAPQIGIAAACLGLGVARATFSRATSGVGAAGQCPACILAPGAERTGTAHDPRVAAPTGLRGLEPPHRVRHAARCGSLPRRSRAHSDSGDTQHPNSQVALAMEVDGGGFAPRAWADHTTGCRSTIC
jgi:hypothetical protein